MKLNVTRGLADGCGAALECCWKENTANPSTSGCFLDQHRLPDGVHFPPTDFQQRSYEVMSGVGE